jgi:hypothetical protein
VLTIYAICIALAALSLVLSGRGLISAFLIIVLAGGLVLFLMTRRARGSLDSSSYPDDPDSGAEATDASATSPDHDSSSDKNDRRSHSQGRA